jgi:hypothetical protein
VRFHWNGYFFDADFNQLGGVFFNLDLDRSASGSWEVAPGSGLVYLLDDGMPGGVDVTPALPPGAEVTPTQINEDWTPSLSYEIQFVVPEGAETFDYSWDIQALTTPWLDGGMSHAEVVAQFEEVVPSLTVDCYDVFATNGHQEEWWLREHSAVTFDGGDGLHRYIDTLTPDTLRAGFPTAWDSPSWGPTYYAAVATDYDNISEQFVRYNAAQTTGFVVVEVTPGMELSYEFAFPEEWDFNASQPWVEWRLKKYFLGSVDPDVRCFTLCRAKMGPYFSGDPSFPAQLHFTLQSDNHPDAPAGHTNTVADAFDAWKAYCATVGDPYDPWPSLVGGPTFEGENTWSSPNENDDFYMPVEATAMPFTVAESFVVPEGVTQMALMAEMLIIPNGVTAIDLPAIAEFLPSLVVCGVGGTDFPAEEEVPSGEAVPGGVRGGSVRTKHGVMG